MGPVILVSVEVILFSLEQILFNGEVILLSLEALVVSRDAHPVVSHPCTTWVGTLGNEMLNCQVILLTD